GRQRGAKATLPAGTAYHNNCDTPITASKPVAASAVDIISDNKATMTSSRRDKSDKVESAPLPERPANSRGAVHQSDSQPRRLHPGCTAGIVESGRHHEVPFGRSGD